MANSRAAKRYAKALFELSQSQQGTETIFQDLKLIKETLNGSRELRNALANPVIDEHKKASILKAVFPDVHQLIHKSFDIMAANERIAIISEMANQYVIIYQKHNNIKEALVTTAFPLDEALRKKVMAKTEELTHAQITLREEVDAGLIGGFILRVDDLEFDASVSGRLKTLENDLKASVAI